MRKKRGIRILEGQPRLETSVVVLVYITGGCFLGHLNHSDTGLEKVVVGASHPEGLSNEEGRRIREKEMMLRGWLR